MENGRSYGCCAAIGGAGTAIFGLTAVTKGEDGYFINLYADAAFTDKSRGTKITVKADMYKKGEAKIAVVGAERTKLRLRIPDWAKKFTVAVNGANADFVVDKGYAVVTVKGGDKIIARMPMRTRGRVLNGKVEFERGPIVLARDDRFGEDVKAPVKTAAKSGGAVAKLVKNTAFYTNETVKVKTKDGEITLCDYSSAGKNYDDENCNVSVWSEIV